MRRAKGLCLIGSRLTSRLPLQAASRRWAQPSPIVGADRPLPAIDSLLAATALQHNLVLVTQNTKRFSGLPVESSAPDRCKGSTASSVDRFRAAKPDLELGDLIKLLNFLEKLLFYSHLFVNDFFPIRIVVSCLEVF